VSCLMRDTKKSFVEPKAMGSDTAPPVRGWCNEMKSVLKAIAKITEKEEVNGKKPNNILY
jgi:hypothetical protein